MTDATRIAVIGSSADLDRLVAALVSHGAHVVGALSEAQVVLTGTSPIQALNTARESVDALAAGAVYADLNPGTPSLKRSLADVFPAGNFADVTVGFAASETGDAAALTTSGPAAAALAELFAPYASVEVISDVPGQAAARNLLRSLLDNGIANVLVDTLWAAETLGQSDWMHQEILRAFETSTARTADDYLADVSVNFKRRQMDMQDVVELLSESGFESTMLAPIQFTHGRLMHNKRIPRAKG